MSSIIFREKFSELKGGKARLTVSKPEFSSASKSTIPSAVMMAQDTSRETGSANVMPITVLVILPGRRISMAWIRRCLSFKKGKGQVVSPARGASIIFGKD